jgi:type I restriction enzyme, S subunit
MKRYKEYKESGVEWIRKIPFNWSTIQIKYLDNSHETMFLDGDWIESKVIVDDGIRYLTTGNIGPGYYKEQGNGFISEQTFLDLNCTEVFPGDLVASRLNKPIGRACIIPDLGYRIVVAVDNVIIRPKKPFNRHYLLYILNDISFSDYTDIISRGATMQRISRGQMGRISIPSPSEIEQAQITNFLDYNTTLIDTLISKKEQLIEKLKEQRQAIINEAVTKGLNPNVQMKDSGIAWLGEIPEHWNETRLKYVAKIKGRIGFKGYTKEDLVGPNEGAITLGAKHISKENVLDLSSPEFISWEKFFESPEIMVGVDDIIFTQRGSLGKVCHITFDIGDATINPSMVILSSNQNIHPRYLYYWLCSSRIQKEVELLQANTAVPMISQYQLANFPVLLPDLREQISIFKKLDESFSKFDHLRNECLNSISLLKSYRQSLISEAVTGKIDVRDWQVPTNN